MDVYQDPLRSPEERARDLCAKLTLREKVGQLNQRLYGFDSYVRQGDSLSLSDAFMQEVQRFGGLGTLYGLYRADPWSNKDWDSGIPGQFGARAYNLVQRYVMEHSRIPIPVLMSSECPHGHQALGGYLLPVNLAVGSSFRPDLLYQAGVECGRELRDMGVNLALVSMLDVLRDPRWGRSEECFGEDPFHGACFVRAIVQGIQSQGVAVVAKHFCAQGETTGGINASAARIGMRELREIHLPAAHAACEAGVKGFMAAYNEIDGVPCHVNETLLRDILRQEYSFDGLVMADGCALDRLDDQTGDNVLSGAMALEAGVDISLWDSAFTHLEEAVERGYTSLERVDEAVIRVLTLKFEQGLFEHPYLPEDQEEKSPREPENTTSYQLAKEGLVLLKNTGVLPLDARTIKSVALIGPAADDVYRQLGDYSPPVRREECLTLLDGCRRLIAQLDGGVHLHYDDGKDAQRAADLAECCDVTILALGGSSNRFGEVSFDKNGAALSSGSGMDCGEGVDVAQLMLPEGQHDLFVQVRARARQVVSVLILGRPYALRDIAQATDALLLSFYPGPWGGLALAQVLFGQFSPSGRLPVSFPAHAGQLPVYYNAKSGVNPLSYRREEGLNQPLFAFGEGFGYSQMAYDELSLCRLDHPLGDDPLDDTPLVRISMRISNLGLYDESAVAMLFVRDMAADVVRRVQELKAFEKVMVPAGDSVRLSLCLSARELGIWNRRMRFEVQPGEFLLSLHDGKSKVWEERLMLT